MKTGVISMLNVWCAKNGGELEIGLTITGDEGTSTKKVRGGEGEGR